MLSQKSGYCIFFIYRINIYKMKRILLPTNFLDDHENVLNYAIDLVKKTDGKLFLLHVYELPIFDNASFNPIISEDEIMVSYDHEIRIKAHDNLKKIIDKYELSNIKHRALLREGNVIDEIVNAIETFDIDLVVMGTKSHEKVDGLFTTNTTKAIIENTTCPIFTIPKTAKFSTISKIVYLSNLNYDESKILNYLVGFAKLYGICIAILHIECDRNNLTLINSEVSALKDIVDKLDCPTSKYEQIIAKDITDGLNLYLKENETNVIAMTTYTTHLIEKLFHKSITKQLLLQTQLPLLVFNGDKM